MPFMGIKYLIIFAIYGTTREFAQFFLTARTIRIKKLNGKCLIKMAWKNPGHAYWCLHKSVIFISEFGSSKLGISETDSKVESQDTVTL